MSASKKDQAAERKTSFKTLSGLPVERLYTEENLANDDAGRHQRLPDFLRWNAYTPKKILQTMMPPGIRASLANFLTRAGFIPPCTAAGCGPCGSTRDSAPPRNPTSATGTCWTKGKRDYPWPSICRRRSEWIPTTRWPSAKWEKSV